MSDEIKVGDRVKILDTSDFCDSGDGYKEIKVGDIFIIDDIKLSTGEYEDGGAEYWHTPTDVFFLAREIKKVNKPCKIKLIL